MKGRFVLITLLGIYNLVYAQKPYTLPQVTPKSPNVAGYEKYGNIPVSLSTGVPNISIPLTSFTVDGLTIPITLTYHNTGLKIEEIPSMMGLGFDLQFGGAISYNQRGINDFDQTNNGLLASSASRQDLKNYINGSMTTNQAYDYLERILNSQEDSEFDLYNMNFLGHSESFYFDTAGKAIIAPKSDLKVYKIDTGLKVIDNTGNQFYFQTPEGSSSYEAVTVYILPTFSDYSAWHLTKIITKNGRVIQFKYKPYYIHYSKEIQFITYHPQSGNGCPGNSNDYSDVLNTQAFLLPDSILFDEGFIKFLLSSSPRQDLLQYPLQDSIPSLSGFYMVNSNGQKVSEYSFSQGYFGSNVRLKLANVQEKSNGEVAREWDFSYYGETSSFPSIFSKEKDHWGYYNGKSGNETLIPDADYVSLFGTYTNVLSVGYADRTSDFNYSKNGLLQTIKYPTGGTTTFEYEPHQIRVNNYSDIVQYPFLKWTSGVPTITQTLGAGSTLYTGSFTDTFVLTQTTPVYAQTYYENDPSYLDPASITFTGPTNSVSALYDLSYSHCNTNYCQGYGKLVLEPGTYTVSLNQGYNYDAGVPLQATYEITTQVLDTSGTLPPFEMGGCRISKIISNDSIAGIRSFAKKFIYDDSLSHIVFRNIPYYISSLGEVYKEDGLSCIFCSNEFKIHSESVIPFAGSNIEYLHVTELVDTSGFGGKIEYNFLSSSNIGGNNAKPYIAPLNTSWRAGLPLNEKTYKYLNGSYSLIRETTNSYFASSTLNIINGIRVDYSAYCNISSPTTRTHITGMSTLFTEQFYPNQSTVKDYLNDTITNITNTTAQSSFHTQPTLIENFDSKNQSVREKTIYSFDYDTTVTPASSEAIGIKQIVRQNILVPIEQIQIKTIQDSDYVVGATLYTYRQDKPVINKIYSLKIGAPVLYSAFTQSSINGSGNFVKDSRYEERVVENKYDQFNNIVEQYKSSDSKLSYIWDYKNYYPIAETANADSNSIAYTSFEADGSGNWSIGSAIHDTTQSITGHNSYQLSNGNMVKSGLSTSETYTVSYWTKSSTPFTISGTLGSPQQGKTINGWTCFVHTVTGVSQVTLSGTGIIDEVRLYPKSAQMTTYTFDPLIGMTSQCDMRNSILYYEYDGFGRLKTIKDQDKNILKTFSYKYQEQQ